ncbi:hypothetical protein HDV62DRAFT_342798 [Trichoderma sp. SZMC 28011]
MGRCAVLASSVSCAVPPPVFARGHVRACARSVPKPLRPAQQVWRHGHADDPPSPSGYISRFKILYQYECVAARQHGTTATHHRLASHSQGTVRPLRDAQCTCTTPGTPKVGRSQVIEVTHPLELFRPPAHLQLFLNLSNRRQQPGRIVPPEPRLFPTPTDPTPESNCCALSPALARTRKDTTGALPSRSGTRDCLVPIPF